MNARSRSTRFALELPRLPYAADALAPRISAETVRYHYGHHHAGYFRTVARLVRGDRDREGASLEEIIATSTGTLASAAAQLWNHTFYWRSMGPRPGRPDTALMRAIEQSFGTRAALARRFRQEALGQFGSGWTWLVATGVGTLDIISTPNAGLRLHEQGWWPLLVCDVWEHAYYIDYRGDRAAYLDAWLRCVDWKAASERYAAARARGPLHRQPTLSPAATASDCGAAR
jgi:Fe-Mn family superoxide dismutase